MNKMQEWVKYIPNNYLLISRSSETTTLDLGCGRFPRNPLQATVTIGCDLSEKPAFETNENRRYIKVLPSKPLPISSNTIDCVTAYDFLEHLPRFDRSEDGLVVNPFIDMMNEIHRVLVVGGIFIGVTPCFPSPAAFGDPTHVNIISEGTHEYFSGPAFARTLGYGFTGEFSKIEVKRIPTEGILWKLNNSDRTIEDRQERSTFIKFLIKSRQIAREKARLIRHGSDSYIHILWVFEKTESQ